MVGDTTKVCRRKRKNANANGGMSQDFDDARVHDMEGLTQVDQEDLQDSPVPNIPSLDKDLIQEDAPTEDTTGHARGMKKKRGPTKMKKVAKDPANRIQIQFTDSGDPYGRGSVCLSSFLGPFVREHVPVTLDDWRNLGDDLKVALWEEVQGRFILEEEWQKDVIFKQMGCLWRASKSRLVAQIRAARQKEQRLQLKPDNIPSLAIWKKFIKEKTSPEFKAKSEKYRALRRRQLPHTCSCKGLVRLTAEMKGSSANPSSVSRVKVWVKAHIKKDGTPVNTAVGETIDQINKIESVTPSSSSTNVREDALSRVLGKDRPGRLRGMGRGVTISKVSFLQSRDKHVLQLKKENSEFRIRIQDLETVVHKLIANNQTMQSKEAENEQNGPQANKTSPMSMSPKPHDKCKLLNWCGKDEIVAEGCWCSSDPNELVNDIPLGPNAVKVRVDIPKKPEAFLWRPATNMFSMQQAEGKTIAWPADKVVLQINQQSENEDNISMHLIKCKVFDWTGKNEIVAKGRWVSNDPNMLVNDIPLGPNAMMIWVDIPTSPKAFLWRPAPNMIYIGDVVGSKVAWPADKVVLENISINTEEAATISSPSSVNNTKKKCNLLDLSGSGKVVAEGRWSSSDPNQLVHFVPLGPNAIRVWVDIPKIPDASLWRQTSELECIEDAVGTTIAWPSDKVVML